MRRARTPAINKIINEDAPWLEARTGCLEHSQREIGEDNIRRFCIVLYLMKQFGTKGCAKGCAKAQRQTSPVPAVPREACEWAQDLVPV